MGLQPGDLRPHPLYGLAPELTGNAFSHELHRLQQIARGEREVGCPKAADQKQLMTMQEFLAAKCDSYLREHPFPDFSPYKENMTRIQEGFMRCYNTAGSDRQSVIRVQLVEGYQAVWQDRNLHNNKRQLLLKALSWAQQEVLMPEYVDLLFFAGDDNSVSDGYCAGLEVPVPVFAFDKRLGGPEFLLMMRPLASDIPMVRPEPDWYGRPKGKHMRYHGAVWRGTTTGMTPRGYGAASVWPPINDWREAIRARLVQFSLDHPDLLDARFSNIHFHNLREAKKNTKGDKQRDRDFTEYAKYKIQRAGMQGKRLSYAQQKAYSMVVVCDGHSVADRTLQLLGSGMAVLLVESKFEDLFNGHFTPWVHYIPVSYSLSDLEERIKWGLSHTEQLHEMVLQARLRVLQLAGDQKRVTVCNIVQNLYVYSLVQQLRPPSNFTAKVAALEDTGYRHRYKSPTTHLTDWSSIIRHEAPMTSAPGTSESLIGQQSAYFEGYERLCDNTPTAATPPSRQGRVIQG